MSAVLAVVPAPGIRFPDEVRVTDLMQDDEQSSLVVAFRAGDERALASM